MAWLDGLARLFGGGRPHHDSTASANGTRSGGPVVIDLHDEDEDDGAGEGDDRLTEMKLLPAPKSKQEFMHELQRNYSEVLEVVRKVDQHLDEQRVRQEELLDIARRMPGAIEELPRIREQQERLNQALEKLTDATLRGQNRSDATMTRQAEALDAVREHAAATAHTSTRMAESLNAMGEGMARVGDASTQLGAALDQLREQDADRNRAVVDAVQRQQRLIVLVAVVAAVSGVATMGVVVLLATGVI